MTTASRIHVIGCGGHAKVVLDLLRRLDYDVAAIFDDDAAKCGSTIRGVPVVGPVVQLADHPPLPAVIAVGDNAVRERIAGQYDLDWLTLVHPFACVDPSATLGPGTVVFAGAVVQADAVLGDHVIVNTAASVDHDCQIGRCVHIAPGVRLAGGVHVGHRSLIGIGAVVIPEKRIGADTFVGAGAVVTHNLPNDVRAVGVPARVVRR